LGCRKKGLREPTCAVTFLILDLHLFKMRFCYFEKTFTQAPSSNF
jgi:hypothetical protein